MPKWVDRIFTRLGLDLDFSIDIGRAPFNQITEDLFLGARPEPETIPALVEAGVTQVVSCLVEADRPKVDHLAETFEPLFIPVRDGMHEDIASHFPTVFDFARSGEKVFVHCEAGVSRSATLVTALLMHRERRPFYETYRDVRARRGEALMNIGFASQLQRFELEMLPDARRPSSLARYLREVCMAPVEVETLQEALERHDYDAVAAIGSIFGEIPRVIQGVRV